MKVQSILVIILLTLLNGCAITTVRLSENYESLFDQIGGIQIIERLTLKLVERLKANKKLGLLFEQTDIKDFQALLTAQICYETGGGCNYFGLSMNDAHSGMAINAREFDVFVDIFIGAMNEVGITFINQNKLLGIFAPMRKDIIYK